MSRDPISCSICWTSFTPNRRQVYCSARCRKTAYERRQRRAVAPAGTPLPPPSPAPIAERNCPHCGNPITVVAVLTTPQAARTQAASAADTDAIIAFGPRQAKLIR